MSLLKGTLLIAGTTIGGGMLALPILTAPLGLFPTLVLYITCCIVMMFTGLILLEVSLWYPDETNLLTLARRTLGPIGEGVTLFLYLFLFYSLMTAYIAGVGELLGTFLDLSPIILKILGVLIFLPFLLGGAAVVGGLNSWLMLLLFASYLVFIILGLPLIKTSNFSHVDLSKTSLALPVIFTAFSYQGTLPSVIHYLKRDKKKVQKAVVFGTLIPLFVYIFWQIVVIGIVPLPFLEKTLKEGATALGPLTQSIKSPVLDTMGWLFGFSALVTSFLGVALGLSDFIADGLRGRKLSMSRFPVLLFALIPPLLINVTYPGLFLKALDVAGGIGCALLLGLLPILMAWQKKGPLSFPGWLLLLLTLFLSLEVLVEIYKLI